MITIGITTYNRLDILKIMAKSLQEVEGLEKCNIRIYDDASTEYGINTLKDLFPNAKSIKRNKTNLKADGNMYNMYKDFLDSGDKILINTDSDLIFSNNCINQGLKIFNQTNGILSLYNSIVIKGGRINEFLLEKPYIGAAGTILSRECIEKILDKFSLADIDSDLPFFDWRWCRYLREIGHNIYCVKKSLVQHIGFSGQNSSNMLFDYGEGFKVEDLCQGQVINDTLLKMAIRDKNVRSWYALFPFNIVPQNSKVVIYGYGSVGQDYVKQIKSNNYCKLEGIVDENFLNMENVSSPVELENMDFDYIVIAMLDIKTQYELRAGLLKKFPMYENKIIVHIPDRIGK